MITFTDAVPPMKPEPAPPFPLRVFVIAETADGREAVRYDTGVTLTDVRETVHFEADLRLVIS